MKKDSSALEASNVGAINSIVLPPPPRIRWCILKQQKLRPLAYVDKSYLLGDFLNCPIFRLKFQDKQRLVTNASV